MHAIPRQRRIRLAAIVATLLAATMFVISAPQALAASASRTIAASCKSGSNYLTLSGRLTQVGPGVRIDVTASVDRGPSWYPVPWSSKSLTTALAGVGSSPAAHGKHALHWTLTTHSGSYRSQASAVAVFTDGRTCTARG